MVLCESMMMGVATNIVAARPTLSSMASNSSHCHPADRCSTLIFFYFMLFVQVSVGITKKIASACIDYIIVCAAVPCPWTGCYHEI